MNKSAVMNLLYTTGNCCKGGTLLQCSGLLLSLITYNIKPANMVNREMLRQHRFVSCHFNKAERSLNEAEGEFCCLDRALYQAVREMSERESEREKMDRQR